MIRRCNEQVRVMREGRRVDVGLRGRISGDGQIEAVFRQLREQDVALVYPHVESQFRVSTAKQLDELRREIVRRRHHAEMQKPLASRRQRRDGVLCDAHFGQDCPGMAQQRLARRRELHGAGLLVEQPRAHGFLELPELHRDGRLGDLECLGGAREGAERGGRLETAPVTE